MLKQVFLSAHVLSFPYCPILLFLSIIIFIFCSLSLECSREGTSLWFWLRVSLTELLNNLMERQKFIHLGVSNVLFLIGVESRICFFNSINEVLQGLVFLHMWNPQVISFIKYLILFL